jgi:hypothetical protein
MQITAQDIADATGDSLATVIAGEGPHGSTWRVDWSRNGERYAVGLMVSENYMKAAQYGAVAAMLTLRKLITATNNNDDYAVEVLCR